METIKQIHVTDHPIQYTSTDDCLIHYCNYSVRVQFDCKMNAICTSVQNCALLFDPEIKEADVQEGKWIHER